MVGEQMDGDFLIHHRWGQGTQDIPAHFGLDRAQIHFDLPPSAGKRGPQPLFIYRDRYDNGYETATKRLR